MLAIQFCSKEGWSLTSLFISGTSRICVLRHWVNDVSMYGDTKNGCILSTNTPIKRRMKRCESDRRARTSRIKSWFWSNLPLTNESGLWKKKRHNTNVLRPLSINFSATIFPLYFPLNTCPKPPILMAPSLSITTPVIKSDFGVIFVSVTSLYISVLALQLPSWMPYFDRLSVSSN